MSKNLLQFLFTPALVCAMLIPQKINAQCTPPSVLSRTDTNRCGPGTMVLLATPSAGTINWYASSTGGALLGSGNSFTTPSITNTTTYYAAAASGSGGVVNGNIVTISSAGNGCGGGVMFNITPTVNITVDSFLSLAGSSGSVTVTVYTKTGTFAGFETTSTAWSTVGSTTITTTSGTMAPINPGAGIPMTAGTTYAVYIGNLYSSYTDGTGSNQTYTNTDLTLFAGSGMCGVFTGLNNPRVFNGTVYYHKGSACESARLPVVATVKTNPSVNLGNDTTICPGISYTFDAGNAGSSYLWSNNATTQSITTNAAGTFNVKVTAPNNCKAYDTILITPGVAPLNVLLASTNLCAGDTATLNAGNNGSSFLWTQTGATTQSISTNTPGTYTVNIKTVDGCKLTATTNLVARPLPVANLGNDTSICDGATITLDAGNTGYTYHWNTGATSQTIAAADSGTYTVTTTTPYSCHITEAEHIAYLPSPRVEGFSFIPLFYEDLGKVLFSPLNPLNVNSIEWDFGDNSPVSNQMNPEHVYTATGYYNVTVKVFNGCGQFQLSQTINVDLPTGIVTLKPEDADVSIYPNPANGYLNIDNNTLDIRMQEVSIFNAVGALVYRQNADNARKHKLRVGSFANGVYSIRILTDKGFVVRKFEVVK
jgi:PKD repeat protein